MNVYRQAMVSWAEELERSDAPMSDVLALEVRTRIMRADLRANKRAKRMEERRG